MSAHRACVNLWIQPDITGLCALMYIMADSKTQTKPQCGLTQSMTTMSVLFNAAMKSVFFHTCMCVFKLSAVSTLTTNKDFLLCLLSQIGGILFH